MYAIRRDLKKGSTYGHWQIRKCITRSKLGELVEYVDGDKNSIVMKECYLHNGVATSTKIFNGANKSRCAWIVCDSYEIIDQIDCVNDLIEISFNPRVSPHYMCEGDNVDKTEVIEVITKGYKLWA